MPQKGIPLSIKIIIGIFSFGFTANIFIVANLTDKEKIELKQKLDKLEKEFKKLNENIPEKDPTFFWLEQNERPFTFENFEDCLLEFINQCSIQIQPIQNLGIAQNFDKKVRKYEPKTFLVNLKGENFGLIIGKEMWRFGDFGTFMANFDLRILLKEMKRKMEVEEEKIGGKLAKGVEGILEEIWKQKVWNMRGKWWEKINPINFVEWTIWGGEKYKEIGKEMEKLGQEKKATFLLREVYEAMGKLVEIILGNLEEEMNTNWMEFHQKIQDAPQIEDKNRYKLKAIKRAANEGWHSVKILRAFAMGDNLGELENVKNVFLITKNRLWRFGLKNGIDRGNREKLAKGNEAEREEAFLSLFGIGMAQGNEEKGENEMAKELMVTMAKLFSIYENLVEKLENVEIDG